MGNGIPVVLVRGILEGGKTSFIIDSIQCGDFGDVGKTLVLAQEDGEIEYDNRLLSYYGAAAEVVDREDWNDDTLYTLVRKHRPQFVLVEVNEMWDGIYLPDYFEVEQVICIADGATFPAYLSNMRQKFVDMIRESDLFILNRCQPTAETSAMKNNIKLINSSIMVVAVDGEGKELRLVTDLPYDVSGDTISLEYGDFGAFYVDSFESKDRYDKKLIITDCQVAIDSGFPNNTFVAGRQAMTCCADDIQFLGHLCVFDDRFSVKDMEWIHLVARIHYIDVEELGEDQIVFEAVDITPARPPKEGEEVVNLV